MGRNGVCTRRLNGTRYPSELTRCTCLNNSRHAVKRGGGFVRRVSFVFCWLFWCVAQTSTSVSQCALLELLETLHCKRASTVTSVKPLPGALMQQPFQRMVDVHPSPPE